MKIYQIRWKEMESKMFWTPEQAIAWANDFGMENPVIASFELPDIVSAVKGYMRYAGMTFPPDPRDALIFLMTELGEFADAVTRETEEFLVYTRHNNRSRDMRNEGGDVLKMLSVTMASLGVGDPIEAMIEKFYSKGWDGTYDDTNK